MKTVLAAIIVLGFGIFWMCFNIIFRKDGKFPEGEISKNENMKKLGIKCMKEQEDEMFGTAEQRRKSASCTGTYSDACTGCGFYPLEYGRKAEKRK